ncbi:MAG TPA: VanZ family protein, partial [Phycisphaerae bacterium]|nr:VanZ family protein [Phycisphaerae bacterium]
MNQTTLEPQPDTAKHPGRMYLILLIAYCILPVYGSIVSKNFQMIPFDVAIERFCNIPYQELFIHSRSDFIANILLFIPLTFLAMGAATRENLSRGKILIAIGILAGAFLISGIIEFAQLYLPSRTPSASDIFAQFIGGVLGIVIWFGLGRRITRWARSLMDEQASEKLAVKILLGYMVFLVLYQTFPFEVTLSPAGLWQSKLKHSDFTIIPFRDLLGKESYVYSVFSKIIITIPLGYLFMLRHKLRTWRVARTVAWAFVFSSLIEMAQMFIKNRFTSSTDIVLGSLGGLIGAMLAVRVGPVASNPLVES